jgi:hypothetical protein
MKAFNKLNLFNRITYDRTRYFILNKDKRSIFLLNCYALHKDPEIIIYNNVWLIKLLNSYNNYKLSHYTYKILSKNILKFSKINDFSFNQNLVKLIIEIFHNIRNEKGKEIFFKQTLRYFDKNVILLSIHNILKEDHTSLTITRILVFISFIVKLKLLDYSQIKITFEKILIANSNYIPLNLKQKDLVLNYIRILNYLSKSDFQNHEMVFFLTDWVVLLKDISIYVKLLQLFNNLFKAKDLSENEIFIEKYFGFLEAVNKTLTKRYINENIEKLELKNLILNQITCMNAIFDCPIAFDINYRDYYFIHIPQYLDLFLHLITIENTVNNKLFLTYILAKIIKQHKNKFSTTLLTQYIDLVSNLIIHKAFLINSTDNIFKKVKIEQQYQECIESLYKIK